VTVRGWSVVKLPNWVVLDYFYLALGSRHVATAVTVRCGVVVASMVAAEETKECSLGSSNKDQVRGGQQMPPSKEKKKR